MQPSAAKRAGEGPIFTAAGEVLENHCRFVRVPAEGLFYFDPREPETTACVHPPEEPAKVSSGAVGGRGAPENCGRDPRGRL